MRRSVVNAGAEKARQVRDIQRAILCTGGDENGLGAHGCTIGKYDPIRPFVAMQPRRSPGDAQAHSEFLRLRQCASRKRLPGNTGGETQVVLDFRARSGLAARGHCLNDAHVEALRSSVHRRRKARWARPDDQQVVHSVVADLGIQPEVLGNFTITRVFANPLTVPDDDRHVFGPDCEALEHAPNVRVAFEIDVEKRITVAREKFTQPQRVRRIARADEHDVAVAGRQHAHSSQDEGAHEQFAQLGVGLHDCAQSLHVDGDDYATLPDTDAHQARATAQRAQLAAEISRRQQVYELIFRRCQRIYIQASGRDDKEFARPIADVHENLARPGLDAAAEARQPRHLRRRQLRKHLRPARFQDWIGHGSRNSRLKPRRTTAARR